MFCLQHRFLLVTRPFNKAIAKQKTSMERSQSETNASHNALLYALMNDATFMAQTLA